MSAPKNPPAFPRSGFDGDETTCSSDHRSRPQDGMSLRDYFAAKAMAAMLSQQLQPEGKPLYETDDPEQARSLAYLSYKAADAMLTERETGGAS
jgi:hypothetical protein